MPETGKTVENMYETRAQGYEVRENTFVDGRNHEEEDGSDKRGRARRIAAEAVLEGLQEAAFICEGYAARLSEGNDHHAEYDAVCECFTLIDRRIQEQRQTLSDSSESLQKNENGSR